MRFVPTVNFDTIYPAHQAAPAAGANLQWFPGANVINLKFTHTWHTTAQLGAAGGNRHVFVQCSMTGLVAPSFTAQDTTACVANDSVDIYLIPGVGPIQHIALGAASRRVIVPVPEVYFDKMQVQFIGILAADQFTALDGSGTQVISA